MGGVLYYEKPSAFAHCKGDLAYGNNKGPAESRVYSQLESAHDGIIDVELDTSHEGPRNLMRIRSMRTIQFDGRRDQLSIEDDLRVTLQT